MKKLFLPLILLTMSCTAQDSSSMKELTEEQQAFQQQIQYYANGFAEMISKQPQVADMLAHATPEQQQYFGMLMFRYAEAYLTAHIQYHPVFEQLYAELTNLTGYSKWSTQINFVSPALLAEITSQQIAQDISGSEEFEENEDLE